MKETIGTVLTVTAQLWFKVNQKAFRTHPFDGATFPHVIKVTYTVDGTAYTRRKWISAGTRAPIEGSKVTVLYRADKPSRSKIVF